MDEEELGEEQKEEAVEKEEMVEKGIGAREGKRW